MVHFLGNQSFDNLLDVEPSERESGLKGKWFLNFIRHNKVNGTQNSCFNKYHNWNYLYFLNSSFNKSTTKQVKVFIFLFEKKKFLQVRSPWIKTNLTGPVKWNTSTLTVLHMNLGYMLCFMDFSMFFYIIICCTLPCVSQIPDTQKQKIVVQHYLL